jgi:hypothetical protein
MDKFTITCYGSKKEYPESERTAKIVEFATAVAICEGSEKERYANILADLASNRKDCRDEWR